MSRTFEKLREHRARLANAGFRRLTAYVSADVVALLERHRWPHESTGQLLDRLLLGKPIARPHLRTEAEYDDGRIRRAIRQIEHSMRPEHRGPRTIRVILRNADGSCYTVTAAGVTFYADGQAPELDIL